MLGSLTVHTSGAQTASIAAPGSDKELGTTDSGSDRDQRHGDDMLGLQTFQAIFRGKESKTHELQQMDADLMPVSRDLPSSEAGLTQTEAAAGDNDPMPLIEARQVSLVSDTASGTTTLRANIPPVAFATGIAAGGGDFSNSKASTQDQTIREQIVRKSQVNRIEIGTPGVKPSSDSPLGNATSAIAGQDVGGLPRTEAFRSAAVQQALTEAAMPSNLRGDPLLAEVEDGFVRPKENLSLVKRALEAGASVNTPAGRDVVMLSDTDRLNDQPGRAQQASSGGEVRPDANLRRDQQWGSDSPLAPRLQPGMAATGQAFAPITSDRAPPNDQSSQPAPDTVGVRQASGPEIAATKPNFITAQSDVPSHRQTSRKAAAQGGQMMRLCRCLEGA